MKNKYRISFIIETPLDLNEVKPILNTEVNGILKIEEQKSIEIEQIYDDPTKMPKNKII